MIPAFLDVGRVCALHERDKCLVRDRTQRVRDDFDCDRIQTSFFHWPTVTRRLPALSARSLSPGQRTVVESNCSMTAGPEMTSPGWRRPRSSIAPRPGREYANQTARWSTGFGRERLLASPFRGGCNLVSAALAVRRALMISTGSASLWKP